MLYVEQKHSYVIVKMMSPELVMKYRAECSCGKKQEWTTTTNSARDAGWIHHSRVHYGR